MTCFFQLKEWLKKVPRDGIRQKIWLTRCQGLSDRGYVPAFRETMVLRINGQIIKNKRSIVETSRNNIEKNTGHDQFASVKTFQMGLHVRWDLKEFKRTEEHSEWSNCIQVWRSTMHLKTCRWLVITWRIECFHGRISFSVFTEVSINRR